MEIPSSYKPTLETLEDRLPVSTLLYFGPASLACAWDDHRPAESRPLDAADREDEVETIQSPSESRPSETDEEETEVSQAGEEPAASDLAAACTVNFFGEPLDCGLDSPLEARPEADTNGVVTGWATPVPVGSLGTSSVYTAPGSGTPFTTPTSARAPSVAAEPSQPRLILPPSVLGGTDGDAATPAASSTGIVAVRQASAIPLIVREVNGGGAGGDKASGSKGGGGSATNYDYFVVGNGGDVNPTLAADSGRLALVGGSTDVDAAFTWMGEKAGGGDFVVIRATGTNAYNSYIDQLVPSLDSVATLVIKNQAGANDPFVYDKISHAEGIFIAGGDQTNYIDFWKDTGVEDAIYTALVRGVPLGGTSAGLAVLGEFDFYGKNGTITSSEALANPYDSRVSLDQGFLTPADPGSASTTALKYLNDVITDSHFMQRDRMGRLLTFMARLDNPGDGWLAAPAHPRGLAISEQTALLIDADGTAHVTGNAYSRKGDPAVQQRNVYFLQATVDPTTCAPGTPLTYTQSDVLRANYDPTTGSGDTFDLNTWSGTGVDAYSLSVTAGVLTSTQSGGKIY